MSDGGARCAGVVLAAGEARRFGAQKLLTPFGGGRRKVAGVFDRLRVRSFTEAQVARVHAPIGLRISAETVEEIAVSIVAELSAVRRGERESGTGNRE